MSAGVASAQVLDWPAERPPRPLPAREIKFPPYEIRTLPNGLRVVAVLHHEQPAVSMRLLIGTGTVFDPAGKLGLARLLASLLDQGTTTKSAKEVNDDIDFMGGLMGAGAASDLSFANVIVMKDNFEMAMRMLSDMVERPAFSPDEIDRQRQQQLSLLKVSLEDPAYIANAVFDRLVYGFNPYGLPDGGTPASLATITRNDLTAFHQKYFAPNNAILAIVGDLTAGEAFDTANKVFGGWKSRDLARVPFVDPPSATRRVIIIDKPDAVQTEIRVGNIGIPRNHPDFMALNLAVRILGGEGSNRLHQVLRTERGLTYGAQADMDTFKASGNIMAETNTRSDATAEVLRLIVDQMWRLQRERVSEGELGAAKAYLTGSFPLTIETPDSIALQVLNAVFYGLPLDELQTFRERVNKVTVDDIERVARFYLKPDAVSVVLVGNAAAFADQLRGVGFGRFETVPLESLDLLTADFKRGGRAAAVGAPRSEGRVGRAQGPSLRLVSYQQPGKQATAAATGVTTVEGEKARALLAQVIAAKGGLATLAGIKSIRAVSDVTMSSPVGDVEAATTTYLQYPNHVRLETKGSQGTQLDVYDGERGWVRDAQGTREVPASDLRNMEANLQRDTVPFLLAAERGAARARLLPDVKDASGTLSHALELSSPTLEPVVLYVDPKTNLITKQLFFPAGQGQPLEEVFSDYRMVDGVNVPFTTEIRVGGRPVGKRRLTDISINPALDQKLFTRPN